MLRKLSKSVFIWALIMIKKKYFSAILFGSVLASSSIYLSLTTATFAESNSSMGQKVAVPFDTCKPEKGVEFRGTEASKVTSKQMEKMFVGNTLLSVDRYGTFAIFYPEKGKSVGWMPKEKKTGYDWSAGNVNFANGKYCRTWKEWKSGKNVNCWDVHKGSAKHYDTKGYYFLCENGVPDGDVHVVLKGNAFEIKYSGNGNNSGNLTQNDKIAEQIYMKYFGKYLNK